MPIKIKSTSGGSVTIDVPSTAVDTTMMLPVTNAGLVSNTNPVMTGNVAITGNVSVSGTGSYISINGDNVSPYAMRNRIINGDMRIDQRFSGAANNGPTAAGAQYVVDRWRHAASFAGKLRLQQNNTNGPTTAVTQSATGFINYFGANTISSNTVNAGDYWSLVQDVEGLNVSDLNWGSSIASPVTLSFWSYSSIAGTHSGSLRNSNGDRSYPFSYTINTANTWQYQTITVPGDTTGSWFSNTGTGISLAFSLGMGTNRQSTAGSWQSGNYLSTTGSVQVVNNANGSFYLTGVQLEKGSVATPFEFRHYTTELQLCQRYCYIIPTNNYYLTTIQAWSTTRAQGYIPFPVTMRTGANLVNPSSLSGATCYGPTGTAINISTFALAVPVAAQNPTAAFIDVTVASGLTAGYAVMLYTTPTAGPTIFSAELGVQN